MFATNTNMGIFGKIVQFFELLYHSTVREIRKQHTNPVIGLINDIIQSAMYVVFFIFFIRILGMRESAIRGSEILYVMTGVFLFLVHNKAAGAVIGTKGALNQMNLHRNVNEILNILSAAIAALYIQFLAIVILLFFSHVLLEPIEFYRPRGVLFAFFIAWFSGICIGYFFMNLSVKYPKAGKIIFMTYSRANMIFSGKMFLANSLPSYMLPMFTWNPLFHTIDHARDSAFVNYTAHRTDIMYPIYLSLGVLFIAFLIGHYMRKNASQSWKARR